MGEKAINGFIPYILAALGAVAAVVAAFITGKRGGRKSAKMEIQLEDHEHAEAINRRVSDNRADRVRRLDNAGWRD